MSSNLNALVAALESIDNQEHELSIAQSEKHLRRAVRKFTLEHNENLPSSRKISVFATDAVVSRYINANITAADPRDWIFGAAREVATFMDYALTASGKPVHQDLLPVGHPDSKNPKLEGFTASGVRSAKARWYSDDARIDDSARATVFAAYATEPGTVDNQFALARMRAVTAGLIPSELVVKPLVAAFGIGNPFAGNNSSIARAARAKMQRRDRKGRFAEMGGGARLFAILDGIVSSITGKFAGNPENSNDMEVEITGHPTIPNGIYTVSASRLEGVRAVLGDDALAKLQGRKGVFGPAQRKLAVPMADLLASRKDAPTGWNANGDGSFTSADGYTVTPGANGGWDLKDENGAVVGNAPDWANVQKMAAQSDEASGKAPTVKARLGKDKAKVSEPAGFAQGERRVSNLAKHIEEKGAVVDETKAAIDEVKSKYETDAAAIADHLTNKSQNYGDGRGSSAAATVKPEYSPGTIEETGKWRGSVSLGGYAKDQGGFDSREEAAKWAANEIVEHNKTGKSFDGVPVPEFRDPGDLLGELQKAETPDEQRAVLDKMEQELTGQLQGNYLPTSYQNRETRQKMNDFIQSARQAIDSDEDYKRRQGLNLEPSDEEGFAQGPRDDHGGEFRAPDAEIEKAREALKKFEGEDLEEVRKNFMAGKPDIAFEIPLDPYDPDAKMSVAWGSGEGKWYATAQLRTSRGSVGSSEDGDLGDFDTPEEAMAAAIAFKNDEDRMDAYNQERDDLQKERRAEVQQEVDNAIFAKDRDALEDLLNDEDVVDSEMEKEINRALRSISYEEEMEGDVDYAIKEEDRDLIEEYLSDDSYSEHHDRLQEALDELPEPDEDEEEGFDQGERDGFTRIPGPKNQTVEEVQSALMQSIARQTGKPLEEIVNNPDFQDSTNRIAKTNLGRTQGEYDNIARELAKDAGIDFPGASEGFVRVPGRAPMPEGLADHKFFGQDMQGNYVSPDGRIEIEGDLFDVSDDDNRRPLEEIYHVNVDGKRVDSISRNKGETEAQFKQRAADLAQAGIDNPNYAADKRAQRDADEAARKEKFNSPEEVAKRAEDKRIRDEKAAAKEAERKAADTDGLLDRVDEFAKNVFDDKNTYYSDERGGDTELNVNTTEDEDGRPVIDWTLLDDQGEIIAEGRAYENYDESDVAADIRDGINQHLDKKSGGDTGFKQGERTVAPATKSVPRDQIKEGDLVYNPRTGDVQRVSYVYENADGVQFNADSKEWPSTSGPRGDMVELLDDQSGQSDREVWKNTGSRKYIKRAGEIKAGDTILHPETDEPVKVASVSNYTEPSYKGEAWDSPMTNIKLENGEVLRMQTNRSGVALPGYLEAKAEEDAAGGGFNQGERTAMPESERKAADAAASKSKYTWENADAQGEPAWRVQAEGSRRGEAYVQIERDPSDGTWSIIEYSEFAQNREGNGEGGFDSPEEAFAEAERYMSSYMDRAIDRLPSNSTTKGKPNSYSGLGSYGEGSVDVSWDEEEQNWRVQADLFGLDRNGDNAQYSEDQSFDTLEEAQAFADEQADYIDGTPETDIFTEQEQNRAAGFNQGERGGAMSGPATEAQYDYVKNVLEKQGSKLPAELRDAMDDILTNKNATKGDIGKIIGEMNKHIDPNVPSDRQLNSIRRGLVSKGLPADEVADIMKRLPAMKKDEASDLITRLKGMEDSNGWKDVSPSLIKKNSENLDMKYTPAADGTWDVVPVGPDGAELGQSANYKTLEEAETAADGINLADLPGQDDVEGFAQGPRDDMPKVDIEHGSNSDNWKNDKYVSPDGRLKLEYVFDVDGPQDYGDPVVDVSYVEGSYDGKPLDSDVLQEIQYAMRDEAGWGDYYASKKTKDEGLKGVMDYVQKAIDNNWFEGEYTPPNDDDGGFAQAKRVPRPDYRRGSGGYGTDFTPKAANAPIRDKINAAIKRAYDDHQSKIDGIKKDQASGKLTDDEAKSQIEEVNRGLRQFEAAAHARNYQYMFDNDEFAGAAADVRAAWNEQKAIDQEVHDKNVGLAQQIIDTNFDGTRVPEDEETGEPAFDMDGVLDKVVEWMDREEEKDPRSFLATMFDVAKDHVDGRDVIQYPEKYAIDLLENVADYDPEILADFLDKVGVNEGDDYDFFPQPGDSDWSAPAPGFAQGEREGLSAKQMEPATPAQYGLIQEHLDERDLDPTTAQAITEALANRNLTKAQMSSLIGEGQKAGFKPGVDPTKPTDRLVKSLNDKLMTKDISDAERQDILDRLPGMKRDEMEALNNKLRSKKNIAGTEGFAQGEREGDEEIPGSYRTPEEMDAFFGDVHNGPVADRIEDLAARLDAAKAEYPELSTFQYENGSELLGDFAKSDGIFYDYNRAGALNELANDLESNLWGGPYEGKDTKLISDLRKASADLVAEQKSRNPMEAAQYDDEGGDALFGGIDADLYDLGDEINSHREMYFEDDEDYVEDKLRSDKSYGDTRTGGAEGRISSKRNENGMFEAVFETPEGDQETTEHDSQDDAALALSSKIAQYNSAKAAAFKSGPGRSSSRLNLEQEAKDADANGTGADFVERVRAMADALEQSRGDRSVARSLRKYADRAEKNLGSWDAPKEGEPGFFQGERTATPSPKMGEPATDAQYDYLKELADSKDGIPVDTKVAILDALGSKNLTKSQMGAFLGQLRALETKAGIDTSKPTPRQIQRAKDLANSLGLSAAEKKSLGLNRLTSMSPDEIQKLIDNLKRRGGDQGGSGGVRPKVPSGDKPGGGIGAEPKPGVVSPRDIYIDQQSSWNNGRVRKELESIDSTLDSVASENPAFAKDLAKFRKKYPGEILSFLDRAVDPNATEEDIQKQADDLKELQDIIRKYYPQERGKYPNVNMPGNENPYYNLDTSPAEIFVRRLRLTILNTDPERNKRRLDKNSSLHSYGDTVDAEYSKRYNPNLQEHRSAYQGGKGSNKSTVAYVRADKLATMPGNPVNNEDTVESIKRDLSNGVGFKEPVVVLYDPKTGKAFVTEGNHRVEAANQAGVEYVPVRVLNMDNAPGNASQMDEIGRKIASENKPSPTGDDQWEGDINPRDVFDEADLLPETSGGFNQGKRNTESFQALKSQLSGKTTDQADGGEWDWPDSEGFNQAQRGGEPKRHRILEAIAIASTIMSLFDKKPSARKGKENVDTIGAFANDLRHVKDDLGRAVDKFKNPDKGTDKFDAVLDFAKSIGDAVTAYKRAKARWDINNPRKPKVGKPGDNAGRTPRPELGRPRRELPPRGGLRPVPGDRPEPGKIIFDDGYPKIPTGGLKWPPTKEQQELWDTYVMDPKFNPLEPQYRPLVDQQMDLLGETMTITSVPPFEMPGTPPDLRMKDGTPIWFISADMKKKLAAMRQKQADSARPQRMGDGEIGDEFYAGFAQAPSGYDSPKDVATVTRSNTEAEASLLSDLKARVAAAKGRKHAWTANYKVTRGSTPDDDMVTENNAPINPASDHVYSASNMYALAAAAEERGYSDRRWMTVGQASKMGATVRQGEQGVRILAPTTRTMPDGSKVIEMKPTWVFNAEQMDNLGPDTAPKNSGMTAGEAVDFVLARFAEAESKRRGGDRGIQIREGGSRGPLWTPENADGSRSEGIRMPDRSLFDSPEAYVQSLMHELTHAVGTQSRMNRKSNVEGLKKGADQKHIDIEELTAELGSAILMQRLGIPYDRQKHAEYVKDYMDGGLVSDDELNMAFANAQAAADYALGNDVLPPWNNLSTDFTPASTGYRAPSGRSWSPDTKVASTDAAPAFPAGTPGSDENPDIITGFAQDVRDGKKSVKDSQSAVDKVTAQILDSLKEGKLPWRKPFKGIAGANMQRNPASKRVYTGYNQQILAIMQAARGYNDPRWMTYNQAQGMGGQVRKGEKGVFILVPMRIAREDAKTGEDKSFVTFRAVAVFNAEQIDGLNLPTLESESEGKQMTPHDAHQFLIDRYKKAMESRTGKPVDITHRDMADSESPHWSPATDKIVLPSMEQFNSPEDMFDTMAHEMVHSTGHQERLDRTALTKDYGNADGVARAKEELIAEIGAATLADMFGIDTTLDNSTAYVKSWLQRLQDHPEEVMQASREAQKAVDYLLGSDLGDWSPLNGYGVGNAVDTDNKDSKE